MAAAWATAATACGGGDGGATPPADDTGPGDTGAAETALPDAADAGDAGDAADAADAADATDADDASDASDAGGGTDASDASDAGDATDASDASEADVADAPPPVCGNGTREAGEGCDDGNTSTEACTYGQKSCTVCAGDCTEQAGATSYCGDGHVRDGEACDDGNPTSGDGCSATCAIEPNVTCAGEPSVCRGICGDGIVGPGEACEDGNKSGGDGCGPTCALEATCSNGTVEPGEQCDDANLTAGDGCSAACRWEAGTVCAGAVDLRDPTKVTVSGRATTYAGTTTGSTLTTFGKPSCSARGVGSPRALHRFQIGGHPAALTIEALPTAGAAMKDPIVWALDDCAKPTQELGCGEDADFGLFSRLETRVLPAGTNVYVAIAGYRPTDAGGYTLRVTEREGRVATTATCAAPTAAGAGTFGGTLAAGPGALRGSCGGAGAETIYALTLTKPSDVRARVASTSGDFALWLAEAPCGTGSELACVDAAGQGDTESLVARSLPAGTYYLAVDLIDGGAASSFALDLDLVTVRALGESCDAADATARCADGLACVGAAGATTCGGSPLLSADFATGALSPLSVVDVGGDGQTWGGCDPRAASCSADNPTGSASGGGYARIFDAPGVSLAGEELRSASMSATGLGRVTLAFDHRFRHNPTSTDEARVEVSIDGTTWNPVAVWKSDAGGRATFDLSAAVAGAATFQLRFVYTDQTSASGSPDPWALGWSIDDVRVVGAP